MVIDDCQHFICWSQRQETDSHQGTRNMYTFSEFTYTCSITDIEQSLYIYIYTHTHTNIHTVIKNSKFFFLDYNFYKKLNYNYYKIGSYFSITLHIYIYIYIYIYIFYQVVLKTQYSLSLSLSPIVYCSKQVL